MNTVRQLADYFAHKVMLGFGSASPKLCRRGLDAKAEINLVVPTEGEQVSDDGKTVYLSGRITE